MTVKKNIKLNLTSQERAGLRTHKVRIVDIPDYAPDELERILDVSMERAREIYALADFQRIPSVGIKFAEDLVFLGYYSVDALKDEDGASLRNEFEREKGYQIDSCVEDQFRLAVNFARTGDYSKNWWDFTADGK